jgi:hypothetical protein
MQDRLMRKLTDKLEKTIPIPDKTSILGLRGNKKSSSILVFRM